MEIKGREVRKVNYKRSIGKLQFLPNLRRIGEKKRMFVSGSFEGVQASSRRDRFTIWNFLFEKLISYHAEDKYFEDRQETLTPSLITKNGKMIIMKRSRYADVDLYAVIIIDPLTFISETVQLECFKEYSGNDRYRISPESGLAFEAPIGHLSIVGLKGLMTFDLSSGNQIYIIHNNAAISLSARHSLRFQPLYISTSKIIVFMKKRQEEVLQIYNLINQDMVNVDLGVDYKYKSSGSYVPLDLNVFKNLYPDYIYSALNMVSNAGTTPSKVCLFKQNTKFAIGKESLLTINKTQSAEDSYRRPRDQLGTVQLTGIIIQICVIDHSLLVVNCRHPRRIYLVDAEKYTVCYSFRASDAFFMHFQTIYYIYVYIYYLIIR